MERAASHESLPLNDAPAPPTQAPPNVWRADPLLVLGRNAALPKRCVQCNVVVDGQPATQNLHCITLSSAIVIVLAFLPCLGIGAMLGAFWLGFVLLPVVALAVGSRRRVTYGLCPQHMVGRRPLRAVKMNSKAMWIKGCCPDYLAQFPHFQKDALRDQRR